MKCGKPLRKMESEFCYDCSLERHEFEAGRSVWLHREPVNQAVYAYKYHDLTCYGEVFGAEMANMYGEFLLQRGVEILVPIPLAKKRMRKRGYNQAEILADKISKAMDIPVRNLLERTKETNPQKQLSDVERRKNIRGAFRVREDFTEKKVALIDDIYTTGSTLDEAAKVLKEAGAGEVFFLTISIGQGF